MKVFFASDHAGVDLKAELIRRFHTEATVVDLGTNSKQSTDYPTYAEKLCCEVLKNPGSLGVLVCGTGVGVSIAANKIKGIRAAAVSEPVSAQMAREHNDAQVLCLGARVLNPDRASDCLKAFLAAKFDDSHPRHKRRIEQMMSFENKTNCE